MTFEQIKREREAFDKWNGGNPSESSTASRWIGWLARAGLQIKLETTFHVGTLEVADGKSEEGSNQNG